MYDDVAKVDMVSALCESMMDTAREFRFINNIPDDLAPFLTSSASILMASCCLSTLRAKYPETEVEARRIALECTTDDELAL